MENKVKSLELSLGWNDKSSFRCQQRPLQLAATPVIFDFYPVEILVFLKFT